MQNNISALSVLKEWGFVNVNPDLLSDTDRAGLFDIIKNDDIMRMCCSEKYKLCIEGLYKGEKPIDQEEISMHQTTVTDSSYEQEQFAQQADTDRNTCVDRIEEYISGITRERLYELKLFEIVLENANDKGCVFLTTALAKMHSFLADLFNRKLATMDERKLLIQSRNDRNLFRRVVLVGAVKSLAANRIAQYISASGEIVISHELWQKLLFSERIEYVVLCRKKCEQLLNG